MSEDWTQLEKVSWTSPPLFNLFLARARIEKRWGAPHAVDCDSNGVGLFDAWAIRYACGLELVLWLFHEEPIFDGAKTPPYNVEIHANQRDVEHILFHIGASGAELARWTPDPCPSMQPRFVLRRLDDNGNTFEVARFTSECEADATAHTFANRGHKQTYWVDPLAE